MEEDGKAGLNKDRLQLEWINASEGERLATKIKEMQVIVSSVNAEEIENSKKMMRKG